MFFFFLELFLIQRYTTKFVISHITRFFVPVSVSSRSTCMCAGVTESTRHKTTAAAAECLPAWPAITYAPLSQTPWLLGWLRFLPVCRNHCARALLSLPSSLALPRPRLFITLLSVLLALRPHRATFLLSLLHLHLSHLLVLFFFFSFLYASNNDVRHPSYIFF